MKKRIRLALDAMGGDFAPQEIILGAEAACAENQDIEIILVGQEEAIKKTHSRIQIQNATEIIHMDESAAMAVKNKKDSSIVVGLNLVKNGQADAFISAGNTGAVMAAALLRLGRIKGIDRPGIAVTLPTTSKPVVLIDAGANLDSKPENLVQFALMGSTFYEKVLGHANPTVGLLNIGSEKGKGDEVLKIAHDLLEQADINFYGNVEGRDISSGTTDVVVCDGFTGNVVLKTMEGLASVMFKELKSVINATAVNKVGGLLLANSLKKLQKRLNQDTYGGAHLLGVNGVCIISHGSAKSVAIKNAILAAKKSIEEGMIEKIRGQAHNEKALSNSSNR